MFTNECHLRGQVNYRAALPLSAIVPDLQSTVGLQRPEGEFSMLSEQCCHIHRRWSADNKSTLLERGGNENVLYSVILLTPDLHSNFVELSALLAVAHDS